MRKLTFWSMVLMLGLSLTAWAQTASQISGTVTDKTGAVIPGATVTITDAATGFHRVMTTNSAGAYAAGAMPAGTYDLEVVAKGFQTYDVNSYVVRPAEQAQVNATLQVGSVSSTVEVQGNAVAQVQLENAAVTNTISGKQVAQLELNGRNFVQLVALTPGVVGQGPTDEGVVGVYGGVSYNINGGRGTENNWEVDGTNVEDNGSNGTINVYPSVDAINQVRVLTSNYGAQYGRDASGTVIVTTKRGTNAWHGDAYEYLRNTDLNARPFFSTARPLYRKNDFGFTVGGPIIKNKTFIFWSSEWRKQSEPSLFDVPVPSAAERAGNFSDVCPAAGVAPGSPDPKGTGGATYEADYGTCPVLTQPTATNTGAYYPNNTLPTSSINQNGVDLLPYIPAANFGSGASSAYVGSTSYPTSWYESLFRVDQQLGTNWHVYYNFIHDSWSTVVPGALWDSASFPTVSTNFVGPGVAMVAHLTGVLSPTMTNEFVAGYTADHIALITNGPTARPASFTMGGLFNNGFKDEIPGLSVSDYNGSTSNSFAETGGDMPWYNSNPTYDYSDQITQVVGNHVLTYGGELTAGQKNEMQGGYLQGNLGFSSGWAGSSGNGFADMLLGNINSFNQANDQPKYYDRYKTGVIFLQDDWHTTSRLTLNLGLQVDLLGAYYDSRGLLYNFVPGDYDAANAAQIEEGTAGTVPQGAIINGGSSVNPNDAVVFNGMENCGTNGQTSSCNQNHLMNYGPRLGFAYDLFGNGKTSLRGGYGIFYDHTNSNDIVDALRNPPLQLSPTVVDVVGYSNVSAASGANFPLNLNGGGTIPAEGYWPMVQQWNLSIQHQLKNNLVAQVAYVGSKGTHLAQEMDLNQLEPVSSLAGSPYAAGGTSAGMPITCPTTAQAAPPASDLGTANQWMINQFVACGGNAAFYRKYPAYNDIALLPFGANSNYNALQASVHGQIGGLFFTTGYTWSHSLDDASGRYDGSWYNGYDLEGAYGNSTFDQPQNFSASWVYSLPLFKGNKWAGGWEYSGIMEAYSGEPFTITNSSGHGDSAGVANGQTTGSYADIVGSTGAIPTNLTTNQLASPQLYGNPAAFAQPVGLTFGNEGRDSFFGPGLIDFDMGLFKNFKITERQTVQFRWETFNTFNHANFSGVNSGDCFTDQCLASGTFLRSTSTHDPRIMQLALKWMF
ncbi:MAG: carboxypeptidase regulatory-like domain-containing protein [Terriglobales bacterium]